MATKAMARRSRSGSLLHRKHSIYPVNPAGSKILIRNSGEALSKYDSLVVTLSSLFFVGGVFWVPAVYVWLVKRFHRIPPVQKRRKAIYAALIFSITTLYAIGPHRTKKVGDTVNVKKWSLWKSWMRYVAYEVVADNYDAVKDLVSKQAILGISPHGIFPFGLGLAAFSDTNTAFGSFRAVVATATQLIPWVRDILIWVRACDASKSSVDRALSNGHRLGLAPGGIAEILKDPDPLHEYAIIGRGIFRMAVKHQVPIIPVYCFGSSMLLKRLKLPHFVEKLSLMLRISLVIFFGKWGLPIPFRQRLLYVMGRPIYPELHAKAGVMALAKNSSDIINQRAERMYQQYIRELIRSLRNSSITQIIVSGNSRKAYLIVTKDRMLVVGTKNHSQFSRDKNNLEYIKIKWMNPKYPPQEYRMSSLYLEIHGKHI